VRSPITTLIAMTTLSLDLGPVYFEALTPKEYLALSAADRANIERTKIVAPRLGERGFGHIVVQYRLPIYKIARQRRKK